MDKNSGFTLIEVLLSIVIFSIIILVFHQFFITSQKGTINSQEKLEALNLSQMVFERVKQGEYEEITDEIEDTTFNCETVAIDCHNRYIFNINDHDYHVTIKVKKYELDLHLIEVLVTDHRDKEKSSVKGLVSL